MDNVDIINKTCKLAGIDRISAKTVNLEDDKVWESIQNNTDLIFQVSGNFGSQTIRKIFSKESQDKIFKSLNNFTRMDLFAFTNALLRPCGKSIYNDAVNGNAHITNVKEIDNLLSSELGYPLFQETQMEFVMKFCGYSFLEADHLRKVIGKKLGTREELPIIKKGFEENAKKTFGLTDKESDNIINPFLQCILDATRYSFCRIHAYSYSYIGYICAYLRYYYPVEYATACLNVWQSKEDKTKEATEYCKNVNIKIKEPVFRHGRPEYSSDSEHREVYKGMRSIKYLNDDCSNGLYLFRNNTYSTFSDLLYDIFHNEQCKINTKQLEILIRLDFFKEFGNSNELLYIYENFQKFKNGDAKSFSKSKTNPESILYSILKRNSTETEKTFTKLNAMNIVREIEEYIKCQNLKDIPIRKKMETQKEYLGYVNLVTEKPEDRPKIIVLEKRVLVAKTGKNAGKPWCIVIDGQSIGSGKKSSYTIYYNNYIYNKFEEFDVIRIKNWHKKNDYYYIDEYEKEFE